MSKEDLIPITTTERAQELGRKGGLRKGTTKQIASKLREEKKGDIMLRMKRITETYDMKVFTDSGEYFGDVEETILAANKVFGWKVRSTRNSFLAKVLGSAKGVIVPHQLVKSVGDIMIISKAAVPNQGGEEEAAQKQ